MENIFTYKKSKDDDYYQIVGCSESSTIDQIVAEYKFRALSLHPDKHPDDPEALVKFQKLQEAKNILCDPEKKKDYDKWRNSGIAIPYKEWKAMQGNCHTVFHWAVPKAQGNMLESSSFKISSTRKSSNISFHRSSDEILRKFRNYEI